MWWRKRKTRPSVGCYNLILCQNPPTMVFCCCWLDSSGRAIVYGNAGILLPQIKAPMLLPKSCGRKVAFVVENWERGRQRRSTGGLQEVCLIIVKHCKNDVIIILCKFKVDVWYRLYQEQEQKQRWLFERLKSKMHVTDTCANVNLLPILNDTTVVYCSSCYQLLFFPLDMRENTSKIHVPDTCANVNLLPILNDTTY